VSGTEPCTSVSCTLLKLGRWQCNCHEFIVQVAPNPWQGAQTSRQHIASKIAANTARQLTESLLHLALRTADLQHVKRARSARRLQPPLPPWRPPPRAPPGAELLPQRLDAPGRAEARAHVTNSAIEHLGKSSPPRDPSLPTLGMQGYTERHTCPESAAGKLLPSSPVHTVRRAEQAVQHT